MSMKVVIMAGGKGTRISSVASDIPKPMIEIDGIPVLEREIQCLKETGSLMRTPGGSPFPHSHFPYRRRR